MKGRKSRIALVGVMALAIALASGSVAEAKKKGRKGGNSVTVSSTGPTALPPSTPQPPGCNPNGAPTPCTGQVVSFKTVPLTVGRRARGTVVSSQSVSVTYTLSGDPRGPDNNVGPGPPTFTPAGTSSLDLRLTAPNGRTVGISVPFDPNATTVGPVTVTANSPFDFCGINFAVPFPATTTCSSQDPDEIVGPPTWTGTVGNSDLAEFAGLPARGTWALRARNASTSTTGVVNSVSLQIPLQAAATSGGGAKKK